MTSFNTTLRAPELPEKKSSRKSSKHAHERMNFMRRIEAIRELKEMGFTQEEIQQQLAQE